MVEMTNAPQSAPQSEPQTHGAARDYDVRAIIEEVSASTKKSGLIPLFIAALAAALAIISMMDAAADRAASVAQLEAANQFAYFQAKNIRKTDSEIAAAQFEALGRPEQAREWAEKAARYEREKGEILLAARTEQAARAKHVRQGDYYSLAVACLQIAIVLASAALVYRGGVLITVSLLLTGLAGFFTVNGHGLYFEVPAEPWAAMECFWSQAKGLIPSDTT